MDGFDCFGCEEVGFDYGSLLQAAGGLASGAASSLEEKQTTEKSQKDEQGKLNAAIQADLNASNAVAQADVSAQLKSASAKNDAAIAAQAAAAQDAAGAGLSPDSVSKRLDAANKSLAFAQKQAKAASKDGYKAAIVKAWTATVNKLQNAPSGSSDAGKSDKEKSQEGWLTRRVLGPIPGYGILVLGVGFLGGIGIAVKKIFFK